MLNASVLQSRHIKGFHQPSGRMLKHPSLSPAFPSIYHFISCGRSPFRRLNVLARYSIRCGSFLIVDNNALSTFFWSSTRADAGFFFCNNHTSAYIHQDHPHFWAPALRTYLSLLPLRKELLLPRLICRLVPRKIPLLSHLLNYLFIDTLQLHLRTRSNDVTCIYSS